MALTRAFTDMIIDRKSGHKLNEQLSELSINVKNYGAKGDGTTDDTTSIQSAITNNPTKTIYFPDGDYLISSTLTVSNKDSEAVNILMNKNARIFTNTHLDYLVKIGFSSNGVYLTPSDRNNRSRRFFIGGVLDCNKQADYGIGFANYIGFNFRDTQILNFNVCGVDTDFYYGQNAFTTEMNVQNIQINGSLDTAGDIGILNRGLDNHFTNCFIVQTEIGVQDYGSGKYTLVHGTAAKNTGVANSTFIKISGNAMPIFNTCYADTYQYGYVNDGSGQVIVNNPIFYNYGSVTNNVLFVNNNDGYFIVDHPTYQISTNNYSIANLPSGFSFDTPKRFYMNKYNIDGYFSNPEKLTNPLDLGLTLSDKTYKVIPNSYLTLVPTNNYVKVLTLLAHNKFKTHHVKLRIMDTSVGNYYEILASIGYNSAFSSATVQIGTIKKAIDDLKIVVTTKATSSTDIDEVNFYVMNPTNQSLYGIEVDASGISNYAIAFNRDAYVYPQTPSTTLPVGETKRLGWSLLTNASY
jgi:hypothetical protein